MKKYFLTAILAIMTTSSIYAEETDEYIVPDAEMEYVQPTDGILSSDYINTYAVGIASNSTGKVLVSANITCKTNTVKKCVITVNLKEYNGTTFVSYSTASSTTNGMIGVFNKNFNVTSGNKYRAYATFKVYDSNDNLLESRSSTSTIVTAK